MPVVTRETWDDGIRASVLALYAKGIPAQEIMSDFQMPKSTFYGILKRAKERGWTKEQLPKLEFVEDKPRSGRPPKISESIIKHIVEIVEKNSII